MRHLLQLAQIEALKNMLRDSVEEDSQLWLDTLEGETDVFEVVSRLLGESEDDEGLISALAAQIDTRAIRRQRAEARIARRKSAVLWIMQTCKLTTLPLPEATVSVRQTAAKLVVNDPAAVPDEYTTPNPKPSMDAIKAAFSPDNDNLPNWLLVEPGRPSLTVRRK